MLKGIIVALFLVVMIAVIVIVDLLFLKITFGNGLL